jgi:hypothetical protein
VGGIVTKRVLHLVNPQVRQRALEAVREAADGWTVTIAEPTRTLEANAKLWALLTDISEQVEWYGKRLTPEDWKHVFSASLRKLTVVPNLDGSGFVALGMSTSRMSKREFSDLLELIQAFGAERGVEWSDEAVAA